MTSTIGVKKIQYPNGTDILTLDSSGSLAIADSATIGGTLDVTGVMTMGAGKEISISGDGGNSGLLLRGNDAAASIVGTHGSQPLVIRTNSAERMRIDSSGNVGIGTSSPDNPLDIAYTKDVAYSVDNFTNPSNTGLRIENTSTTANAMSTMQFRCGSGADLFFGIEQKSANDGDFVFGNQNSTDIEMARITNRPCLVVGASTDTNARIYGSRGDAGDTAMFESTSSASSGVIAIRTSIGQNNNNTNSHHLFAITQNVASFKLHGNGSSTFSSDERLKKNIETTRDGYLEDLAKLRVVKYNWHCDDNSTDKELGLIAQEVQKVFPKLIVEDDVELNGIEKPLALKVSVLPMMLLKALQEANTKITALESRITALEGE